MKTFCIIVFSLLLHSCYTLENEKTHLITPLQTSLVQKLLMKNNIKDTLGDWCPPNQFNTYCTGAQPCCQFKSFHGCCPYSYGVCCDDGTCVPNGKKC
ncbi:hypothetical protein pb186bvf_001069 [Paramecium bursaria]